GVLVLRSRPRTADGPATESSGSVIRSWIAVSLVLGLVVFCAAAFLVDDASLRSTLFGGLIASVGAAVAFYFSSGTADQARSDVLNAALAGAHGGTQPTGFVDDTPPGATVGTQYSYQFVANGFPTPHFSLASGTLPTGLVLSANGLLEGTPTAAGPYTFAVR